jgi:hypothetical protein
MDSILFFELDRIYRIQLRSASPFPQIAVSPHLQPPAFKKPDRFLLAPGEITCYF